MRRDHEGAALGHLFDDVAVAASTSSAAARSSATDADGRVDLRERGADLEDHEQMHTLRGVRLEAGQCDDAPCFSGGAQACGGVERSEEHTSELPSLMRSSYAVFCLK